MTKTKYKVCKIIWRLFLSIVFYVVIVIYTKCHLFAILSLIILYATSIVLYYIKQLIIIGFKNIKDAIFYFVMGGGVLFMDISLYKKLLLYFGNTDSWVNECIDINADIIIPVIIILIICIQIELQKINYFKKK